MRELRALVSRHLLETLRGRDGRRQLLLLVAAAVVPAVALRGGPSSAVWAALALLGLTVLGLGASSGQCLPMDRDAGRAAWLATLAPPPFLHRLAPALAGMGLALLAALLGALFVVLVHGGRALPLRHVLPLEGFSGRTPFQQAVRLSLPARPAGASLELALARKDAKALLPLDLAWTAGTGGGTLRRPPGLVQIPVPDAARELRLENRTAGTGLVIQKARWLLGSGSFPGSVLLAGLVLGLLAASLVPLSVFVSRFTSAPTAIAAGFVAGLLAFARPWLVGLVPAEAPTLQALALRAIDAFAHLTPDVGLVHLVGEPAAGRALAWSQVLLSPALLPLIAYTLIGLGLVALPAPRMLEAKARP